MNAAAFASRLGATQELGRFVTDTCTLVFHDNGTEVGVWREAREAASSYGEVFSHEDAMSARMWWWQQADMSLDLTSGRPSRAMPVRIRPV